MTRTQLINSLISRYGYKDYLEIGVNTPAQPGWNFDSVKIKNKDGVDPDSKTKANFIMTSDEFFDNHINKKYDIIFVDGLHIFEQAYRDIVNSLKWLNENGTIVVHDCNPTSEITQRRERASSVWHGDVWKAILKLRSENENLEIYTVNTDEGCAIIRSGRQKLINIQDKEYAYTYNFFNKNRKEILNLVSIKEFKKKINSTICVKIVGGMGNQMFQYSFGKYLSIKNKDLLFLDISFYERQNGNTKRKFDLNIFNITSNKIAKAEEIKNFLGIYRNRIISKLLKKFNKKPKYLLEEEYFEFNNNFKNWNKENALIIGYFQSEKYFKEIEDIIKNEFKIKNELLSEKIKKITKELNEIESVSIHVRRGDYVSNLSTNKYHGVLPIGYYKKAIDIINKKINNPTFYLFSDDIEWCKNNLKDLSNNIVFIEKQKDYEDLELMKNCKHNIIANSSFSWWGAWLNENSEKIVIAPNDWFANKNINTKDLIPETWIKI